MNTSRTRLLQIYNFSGTIEDLTQELTSERERLQIELSSMVEQNQLLSKAIVAAQNDLQTSISQLEEQLKEYEEKNEAMKSELENGRLEAAKNSALETRVGGRNLIKRWRMLKTTFQVSSPLLERRQLLACLRKLQELSRSNLQSLHQHWSIFVNRRKRG